MPSPVVVAGVEVAPGTRQTVAIPVARQLTTGEVAIPACVIRGRRSGPRLFVSAAIHGDEINGVEIVRRLLRMPMLKRLRGTLIAVPVVNVYGFIHHSRYLPDRRDLNRSFPGSPNGSLASRLAHTFLKEVVEGSTHGIDLHTGSLHRTNLPQVRATFDDEQTEAMGRAFGAPVMLESSLRDGSLRAATCDRGIPILVYEGGEALRFDELVIRAGVRGVLSVMRSLGMLPPAKRAARRTEPFVARGSTWVRAPETGILTTPFKLGHRVEEGQRLGSISDPLGTEETPVIASADGMLIGRTLMPLVNAGDALFHVASFKRLGSVVEEFDVFRGLVDEDIDPA